MHPQFSNGSGEGQRGSSMVSMTPSTRGCAHSTGVTLGRVTNQLHTSTAAPTLQLQSEGTTSKLGVSATVAIDEPLPCAAHGEDQSEDEADQLEEGTLDSLHGFSEGSDDTNIEDLMRNEGRLGSEGNSKQGSGEDSEQDSLVDTIKKTSQIAVKQGTNLRKN
jgi:hypothetical protein